MKVKVTQNIDEQRISDLLCGAFEGGSNYWYLITKYNYADGITRKDVEFPHIELPLKLGCSLTIKTNEDDNSGKEYTLDLNAIKKGLSIMANKHTRHFADFIAENDDATTADVFLQCCLFHDVIYG